MRGKRIILGIALSLMFVYVALVGDIVGVSQNSLEKDARRVQQIDETWEVVKSVNEDMSVLLFYDKSLNRMKYSMYLNRDGFSWGYFFVQGGSITEIEKGVYACNYKNSMGILSLNEVYVEKIEMTYENNLSENKVYNVDSDKPFALVIPIIYSDSTISLYDKNGDGVPLSCVGNF